MIDDDFPPDAPHEPPEDIGPLCGRCLADGELYPANCTERPELMGNAPIGMYHCPDCGAMLLAGVPHPPLCAQCRDRTHPHFDGVVIPIGW